MNKGISLLVIALILASFPLVLAHGESDAGYDGHHAGMMGGFYGGTGMWFGWVFMILIVMALVLFIVWLIKQLTQDNRRRR